MGLEGGELVLELHVTIDVVRDDLTAEFTSCLRSLAIPLGICGISLHICGISLFTYGIFYPVGFW